MEKIQRGKTVCLITPGHLASDPRLVKEAMVLSQHGFKVHLIFTQYVSDLVKHDECILESHPAWTYQSLNWTGDDINSKINRLSSKLVISLSFNPILILNRNLSWQKKKATNCRADLYVAHNLGALPVAVYAAKKNKAKCGFDAEDFHRHEVSDDVNDPDVKLKTAVEDKYISQVDYITASSPQIADRYALLFNRGVTPILNVFPKIKSCNGITTKNEPLKLFWFSQTIGQNRGLEMVIEAINISKIKMEFHLLGKISDTYKKQLLDINETYEDVSALLHFHRPVPGDDLLRITTMFDIGIASEPGFSINNRIALSNKLFTYIQCGLALVASNTIAQSWFMEQYPETGKLYENSGQLVTILLEYHYNRALLNQTKCAAYNIGQTLLNWEFEGKKFIEVITPILSQNE